MPQNGSKHHEQGDRCAHNPSLTRGLRPEILVKSNIIDRYEFSGTVFHHEVLPRAGRKLKRRLLIQRSRHLQDGLGGFILIKKVT